MFHIVEMRAAIIFPVVGLLLFTAVSIESARVNDQLQQSPNRYYWWSSLRLDSDPLNQNPRPAERCQYDPEACANWDVPTQRQAPGWLDRVLVVSGLPAFLLGVGICHGLGRHGVDEVLSFMVAMPELIFGWSYLLGWLLESWIRRRKLEKKVPLTLTQGDAPALKSE